MAFSGCTCHSPEFLEVKYGGRKFQAYGRDLSAAANSCKLSSQCDVLIIDAPRVVLWTFKLTDPELQRGEGVGPSPRARRNQ